MALSKCQVSPESSGYSATLGATAVAVQLEGGAPRYRADQLGASAQVSVQWSVGRDDYKYLMAFYRTAVAYGSQPFLIDLLLEDADLAEYQAFFQPGSMKLSEQRGLTYVVQATLDVLPLPPDPEGDALIMARN